MNFNNKKALNLRVKAQPSKWRKRASLLLPLFFVVGLSACGGDTLTGPSEMSPAPQPATVRVALADQGAAWAFQVKQSGGNFDCYKGPVTFDWPFTVTNGPVQLKSYDLRIVHYDGSIAYRWTGPSKVSNDIYAPGTYHWRIDEDALSVCHPSHVTIAATFVALGDGAVINVEGRKLVEVRQ